MGTLIHGAELGNAVDASDAATWRCVQPGIWVGHRDGAFVGMIEQRWSEGYLATTRLGKNLGTFSTMEGAQLALR